MSRYPVAATFFMLAVLPGCSGKNAITYTVDGQTFDIPAEYLIETGPPWLPHRDERVPLIALNPNAATKDQTTILLQDATRLCRGTSQVSGDWSHLCNPGWSNFDLVSRGPIRNLRKIPDAYNVTRRYVAQDDQSAMAELIAVCTPISGSPVDTCTHLYRSGGLIVTVSLKESEIKDLPKIRSQITGLLQRWERRGSS